MAHAKEMDVARDAFLKLESEKQKELEETKKAIGELQKQHETVGRVFAMRNKIFLVDVGRYHVERTENQGFG